MRTLLRTLSVLFLLFAALPSQSAADSISDNPIAFVTMVPNPSDFGTLAATFGNHQGGPDVAFRGGDLWIRYSDGSLKNLTSAAGFGNAGFQGSGSIAVRDPAVHWGGEKIIFSMIIGNPTQQYQLTNQHWQLYEISGLGPSDTPLITLIPNQPSGYNNISPTYASDDSIIFVSDRPRDNTVLHTYPQRDEYESAAINSGIWKLVPASGDLRLLDHAPSGDFNPIIDSFGRVIFTRWDHLQRDQQNVGGSFGAFNYTSEASTAVQSSAAEVFPEPRSILDPDYVSTTNFFTINQFFPWMMNQDGMEMETLNHIGRQEVGLYSERSFNNDPNVQEFYGQYSTGQNQNEFTIFLHIKESPTQPGNYFGTNCQEFGTHAAGQILSINGAPGVNPDNMLVTYLTHPSTAGATDAFDPFHSGLYRDPLPLSNGKLLASHTANTRQDANIGTSNSPLSRYDFRLKLLSQSGQYFMPSTPLTAGITKSVSFWSPDSLISYNGQLWEMMPVEVKARARPSAPQQDLPAIEASVLSSLGVAEAELREYLRSNNLALVVSRNVTMRDRNDRQQPTNLRVQNGGAQTLPHSGKIYDLSQLQFFQGDLIRGYNGHGAGRRVLAQPMAAVSNGVNPSFAGQTPGSVQIAEDGSTAAFVPARRALSWQLSDPNGAPVVRERYWLTFQPGEIRVCASCHGINTADHLGRAAPTNSPLALARLLAHWKDLPAPAPTPTAGPGNPNATYVLTISAQSGTKPGKRFTLTASGGESSKNLLLRTVINGVNCPTPLAFKRASTARSMRGKFPLLGGATITFKLVASGSSRVLSKQALKLSGKKLSLRSASVNACQMLTRSLKTN